MSSPGYQQLDEQDESLGKKHFLGDFRAFITLFSMANRFRLPIVICILLLFVTSFTSMISARLMGTFVEDGLLASDYKTSFLIAGIVVALELFGLLVTWKGTQKLVYYSSFVILSIREKLFDKLQILPMKYYDKVPQGRVVTRITHDVIGVERFYNSSLGRFVSSLFMASAAMVAMIATDYKIGIIMVISVLPALIFMHYTRVPVRAVSRKMSSTNSSINSKLSEFVDGMEVIRIFGLEKWSKKHFDKRANEYLDANLKANVLFSWTRPVLSSLTSVPYILLLWFGGKAVFEGTISIGIFVAFMRYSERFFHPLLNLARELHVVQQAFSNSERLVAFLNAEEEEDLFGKDGDVSGVSIRGRVELENLTMAYDENDVLKDVSLTIEAGEKIGLVGRTGSGKTTIISLLARLYEFQKGVLTIDKVSIRDFNRNFLRDSIGIVSQDVVIFKGALRENLSAGKNIPDSIILEACNQTGFSQVMKESSMDLDFEILENGANLSVGERQLLSFTRVLLKDPKILILDEATANIDPKYEKLVHNAAFALTEGRTCIIIAHRLDTLRECNRLFVFKDGQLVEQGHPEDLLRLDGHFARLHQASSRPSES